MAKYGPLMRRRILIALLIVAVVAAVIFYFSTPAPVMTPREAAEWLRGAGEVWWAPLAYLVFYTIFTLILVPPLFLSAAAALMWGWFLGGVIELVVATAAALVPYAVARWTGAAWVRERLHRRGAERAYDRIQREGFLAVLLFRLVPVVPYVILNYLSGFADIRLTRYLSATLLGMIPSIFVFTYFVDAVARGTTDLHRAFPRMLLAGAIVAAVVLLTRAAARRLR